MRGNMKEIKVGSECKATVLVVEDSPTQAMHVHGLLEEQGVNVVLAGDGPEGLALAQRVRPDLVILDMQLPGMNGLEVCSELKGAPDTADIPVILFTRHDDPQLISMGLQSGIVDYIPKDVFADAVLVETLRQMGLIKSPSEG